MIYKHNGNVSFSQNCCFIEYSCVESYMSKISMLSISHILGPPIGEVFSKSLLPHDPSNVWIWLGFWRWKSQMRMYDGESLYSLWEVSIHGYVFLDIFFLWNKMTTILQAPRTEGCVYACVSHLPFSLSLSLSLYAGLHGCGWGVCVCVACVCDFGNWSRLIKAQSVIKGQSNCSSCANYKQYLTQVTYFI